MRRHFIIASAMALVLSGCGGHQALPVPLSNGQSSAHHAKPLVLQTGKSPVNWTRFAWGGSTSEATSGDTIVTGPDKNIWYTDYYKPGLVKMTMSGAAHEYTFAGFNPTSMTVGSDGKFYIGEYGVAKIAVVTTSGTVAQKTIPSGDYVYQGGMTLGPDGNVWFAELSHLGMITPAGTITEYAYPDGSTQNYYGGITAGPDGDIWAVETYSNIIDDVDVSNGSMVSYPLGCTSTYGSGVVAARDGNIYVDCYNYIARVTTSGQVSLIPTFNMGYDNSDALTLGPDGNPWFIDNGGTEIGEYNTSNGELQVYFPPSTYGQNWDITAGPDGNLWTNDGTGHTNVYIIDTMKVAPTSVTLNAVSDTANITVTEPSQTSWTATTSSSSVATVAQGSPADKFVITATGVGSCTITVSDAIGNLFKVAVTVK